MWLQAVQFREFDFHLKDHLFPTPLLGRDLSRICHRLANLSHCGHLRILSAVPGCFPSPWKDSLTLPPLDKNLLVKTALWTPNLPFSSRKLRDGCSPFQDARVTDFLPNLGVQALTPRSLGHKHLLKRSHRNVASCQQGPGVSSEQTDLGTGSLGCHRIQNAGLPGIRAVSSACVRLVFIWSSEKGGGAPEEP